MTQKKPSHKLVCSECGEEVVWAEDKDAGSEMFCINQGSLHIWKGEAEEARIEKAKR